MHARVGVMEALNRNVERTFNPSRKDTHWGVPVQVDMAGTVADQLATFLNATRFRN